MFLEALVTSGRIADIILAVMAVEAAIIVMIMFRDGSTLRYRSLLAGLAAGGSLILALRVALVGGGWAMIVLFLVLGLVAHVVELGFQRYR